MCVDMLRKTHSNDGKHNQSLGYIRARAANVQPHKRANGICK